MKNESGVPIKKPTPILSKSFNVNFPDLLKTLGDASFNGLFGRWDSLPVNGIDALIALGLATGTEEVAWLLLYRSLLRAMKSLVDEQAELESETFDIKDLQKHMNETLANSSVSINNQFFEHPEQSAIIPLIQPLFAERLTDTGLSKAESDAITQRLPIYFAMALHEEWGNRSQDYGALKEKLDTPFTQADERAQAQLHYAAWLQKQVEEPLFLEAFSLKQVFVPLRAYYYTKVTEEEEEFKDLKDMFTGEKQPVRVVVDLESELEKWVHEAKPDNAIRLISGGPGSGKSSLTKMFAAKLAAQGTIPVLFVPLHHFDASNDLIDAVGKFVKLDGFLPYNPLDIEYRANRLLIIFDGLDELAMQGKIAEGIAQAFVWEVQRKVMHFNQRGTYVQVLISGREVVVQAHEMEFRGEGQILHVLPYFVSGYGREEYLDPQEYLKQDQRQLWWRYYGRANGSDYTKLPQELNQNNLAEITAQPLLNYLVALSFQHGKLQFSEETNLNAVYADLLKAIYERGWADYQHVAIQGIEEEDFVRILEEIALATWHGNGRTTTVKEIENQCNNSGFKNLLTKFQTGIQEDSKTSVTRLLTAFYFRQSGHNQFHERTFEFTHKSFGEYLTARRIVREIRLMHKQIERRKLSLDEGWDEHDALYRWVLLCGSSTMDQYLFNFVSHEVQLQYFRDSSVVVSWQQMFCHLIKDMTLHGMPVDRLNPRPVFQEENRQARNAEENLLAVLGIFQRSTKIVSQIQFPSQNTFGSLLTRLQDQRVGSLNPMSFSCLSYLDLSGCTLNAKNLNFADLKETNLQESNLIYALLVKANLQGANLQGADLEEANLRGADLQEANLQGANLQGVDLRETNLQNTDLRGAYLQQTNLQGVDLMKTYLCNADLQDADLRRTDLQNVDLTSVALFGADLQGADLRKTDLKETHLQGANLQGANLQGADLQGVDLQGADLQGADLEEANLQGADLQEANLQKANLQRAYLQEADLQKANLQLARLEEANLLRANLQEANLQDAILYGADLEKANLQGAYLQRANLQLARLEEANLRGAHLQDADLQDAGLQGAYLQGAYLWEANLERVDLDQANLQGAYLQKADLQGANLEGANLQEANLQGANLYGTILQGKEKATGSEDID